ncbi:MAG: hypothetical protein ACTH0Y_03800, partial [Luteimonas sp.]
MGARRRHGRIHRPGRIHRVRPGGSGGPHRWRHRRCRAGSRDHRCPRRPATALSGHRPRAASRLACERRPTSGAGRRGRQRGRRGRGAGRSRRGSRRADPGHRRHAQRDLAAAGRGSDTLC